MRGPYLRLALAGAPGKLLAMLRALLCCLLLPFGPLAGARAQRPAEPPIDDELLVRTIEARCRELREAGELVRLGDLHVATPPGSTTLALATPRDGARDPTQIHALARASAVLVGVYYRCGECEEWHLDASSGFVVSAQGDVATCWHVLEADADAPDSYAIVADLLGRAWPVRAVRAANPHTDVCIVATGASGLTALPLRAGVRVGERVYCLSNPDHRFGHFGEGMVARWFVDRPFVEPDTGHGAGRADAERDAPPPIAPGRPALEVTLDFAQGSSGAAVLDAAGNVVGIAQATATLTVDGEVGGDVQMVVKVAAPAAALLDLVLAPR